MKNYKMMFHLLMFSTLICVLGYIYCRYNNMKGMEFYWLFFASFNFVNAIIQYKLWNKNK